jgi:hypothetical protein
MATTEITTTTNDATLTFGDRATLKEIADRLRVMMPNAQKLTEGEALAVAQVARAHDLDPFTGEVWGLKSKDGTWYGVMVGIKGQRKSARREANKENGTFWTEIKAVDASKYGATKPGSLVYECILRDTVTVQAWGKSVNILTTSGVPYAEAVAMLGACPQIVGIGIADPSENSKMAIHQRAKKRAEADAIKQRYDISFGAGIVNEGSKDLAQEVETVADEATGEIIDGVSIDVPPAPPAKTEAEKMQAEADYRDACETLSEDGQRYGDRPDEKLAWVIRNPQSTPQKQRAAQIILDWRKTHKTQAQNLAELGY